MPDSPPQEQAQRVLAGRYRLVRTLASGGMAEVWEGYDDVLARPVAVKTLHPHLAVDTSFRDRLRGEAVAAARLAHPNIVATFDAGVEGDTGFIVMELVRGTTLRELLHRNVGPLRCRTAVDIAAQVADALHYAHRMGIVHRDVKPANILCQDGRAKVADFGIAKGDHGTESTLPGTVLGTVAYLAPEQVDGREVDRRTDVYALGVMLYEMLCGRPPFQGGDDLAVALQRLRVDPLRPRQLRADIPRALERVVLRAMARDPERRFPTAAEFRSALLAVDLSDEEALPLADEPTPPRGIAPSFRQTERTWLVPATLIVVISLVLGVVGVLFTRTEVGHRLLGDVRTQQSPASPKSSQRPSAVPIVSATSFDPPQQGDGVEHEADVPNLLDGDPSTTWRTERYNSPDFGNLKAGVGIVLRLQRPTALSRLDVTSTTTGWSAQVFVAAQPGRTLREWGSPVAAKTSVRNDASFDLQRRVGAAVLLWITRLGDGQPNFTTALGDLRLSA